MKLYKVKLGNIIIFSEKHFNWFRKLMYKLAFDIKIEDMGEKNVKNKR